MQLYKARYKTLILLLLTFCAINSKAQTQDTVVTYTPNHTYYWAGIHIGGGTYLANGGFDGTLLLKNKFLIAAKLDGNANELFFGNTYMERHASEAALMFGLKLTNNRYSNLMLLTGASYVTIGKKDPSFIDNSYIYDNGSISYTAIGIPVALKYLMAPTNFFAMEFGATANYNKQRSFFALTFGIAFGNVRDGGDHLPKLPSHY